MATREWEYMEARRKEFEAAYQEVVRLSNQVTEENDLKELARAWGASDGAYRQYAEAYRTFFQASHGRRRRG